MLPNQRRAHYILTEYPSINKAYDMTDTTTLSAKFQISIPKAVRAPRRWRAGQKFAFIPKGAGVLLVPVPEAEELVGIAAGADTSGYRDRDDRF